MIICTGLAAGACARASGAAAATIRENKTANNCLDRMRLNVFRGSGISASGELSVHPPPFTGEGWGGGEHAQILSHAPPPSLPPQRGRESTEGAAWIRS